MMRGYGTNAHSQESFAVYCIEQHLGMLQVYLNLVYTGPSGMYASPTASGPILGSGAS
jgi:hypothetical protein